jgi:hypothetical protein
MLHAMPLEGHYRRVNTPLRKLTRRELTVVIAGAAVILIAILALLFLPAHNDRPLLDERGGARPGCIEVFVAGRVGNEPVVGCGRRAREICRRAAGFEGQRAETVVDACFAAGVKF